ncbi:MAG: sugar transferase [Planctomycetes bacterium]|nr:sugar transferase [Planctomycetota bacterium]
MRSLWSSWSSLFGLGSRRSTDLLLRSAEAFQDLMLKERARSDRTGDCVSLLAITPGERDSLESIEAILCGRRRRRLRCTDELGWLGPDRIGILLPCTSSREAIELASSITAADHSGRLKACRWEVYTHYHHATASTDENGQALPIADRRRAPADVQVERRHHDVPQSPSRGESGAVSDPAPALPLNDLLAVERPWIKRATDVVGALLVLLVMAPFMLLSALAIKLTSPGPVIYTQQRAGRNGRPFTFYKFRTMCVDADKLKEQLLAFNEQTGPAFKMTNDPRVTTVGRFLRKTSLDELPQLWNVLRGDISLVGPRPPITHELQGYEAWQMRRLDTIGGLTCTWQVSGRNKVLFEDWVRMDLRYIEQGHSFVGDMKLLVKTVPAVLARRGAS